MAYEGRQVVVLYGGGTAVLGKVYLVDASGTTISPAQQRVDGEPREWEGNVDSVTEVTIPVNSDLGRLGTVGYVMNNSPLIKLHIFISKDGTTYNGYASFAAAKAAAHGWVTCDEGGLGYALDKHKVHTIKLLAASGTVPYRTVML
jgi:hypothetical protein